MIQGFSLGHKEIWDALLALPWAHGSYSDEREFDLPLCGRLALLNLWRDDRRHHLPKPIPASEHRAHTPSVTWCDGSPKKEQSLRDARGVNPSGDLRAVGFDPRVRRW
jgi:hypothetical protein